MIAAEGWLLHNACVGYCLGRKPGSASVDRERRREQTGREVAMPLRTHMKMTWRGAPNWPPRWGGSYDRGVIIPAGEEGVLLNVEIEGADRKAPIHLKLTIEFQHCVFSGVLHFDDPNFIPILFDKLSHCTGRTIREVGDLELD